MHSNTLAARCALTGFLCLVGTNAAPTSPNSMLVRSYQSDGTVTISGRDIDDIQDAAPADMLQQIDDILGDIHTKRQSSKRGTLVKRLASQYLPDFDMNNPTDSGHVAQLQTGQTNAVELTSYLEQSWDNVVDSGIYGNYFADGDKDAVQGVYQSMWSASSQ